jgi:hypothetical protein
VEYAEYLSRMRAHRTLAELTEYGTVRESERDYPLIRLRTSGSRRLLITSGFHGEEPAGPLTLLEHLPQIVDYARERDVGLSIYPCINPSGFEDGTRYNRSGEKPNNDFLRYEVARGQWKGELTHGEAFLRWTVFDGGPKETRAVRAALAEEAEPHAALDIHQDRYIQGAWTYAYAFGDKGAYAPLLDRSEALCQVIRSGRVDDLNRSDEFGLVEYHDGSVTDWFWRRGVPFAAALETTTWTPLDAAHQVNLLWIRGFVDLAAAGVR